MVKVFFNAAAKRPDPRSLNSGAAGLLRLNLYRLRLFPPARTSLRKYSAQSKPNLAFFLSYFSLNRPTRKAISC